MAVRLARKSAHLSEGVRTKMELEHLFQQTGTFMTLQMLVMGSLIIPAVVGRDDIYHAFVRRTASHVVTFGPVSLLGYILYEVTKLS